MLHNLSINIYISTISIIINYKKNSFIQSQLKYSIFYVHETIKTSRFIKTRRNISYCIVLKPNFKPTIRVHDKLA